MQRTNSPWLRHVIQRKVNSVLPAAGTPTIPSPPLPSQDSPPLIDQIANPPPPPLSLYLSPPSSRVSPANEPLHAHDRAHAFSDPRPRDPTPIRPAAAMGAMLTTLTGYAAPVFLILSPILSYSDQAMSMQRLKSSAGFSLDIPLIMLVASICR